MLSQWSRGFVMAILCGTLVSQYASGQANRFRNDRDSLTTIRPGTVITVRTSESIDSRRVDDGIFTGRVVQDVFGRDGDLAVPRGSRVELVVRESSKRELVLDMQSVTVRGQRYAIAADENYYQSRKGVGSNRRTGKYVGGGAVLGSIIGAIAGGGKGAAIGAAAGAAAGAGTQTLTRGSAVRIPAESILTFRVERPLTVSLAGNGYRR